MQGEFDISELDTAVLPVITKHLELISDFETQEMPIVQVKKPQFISLSLLFDRIRKASLWNWQSARKK